MILKRNQTEQDRNPYCQVFVINGGEEFDVYLNGQVGSIDLYTELLHLLFTAEEDVKIHLKINSPGGDLDTGLQIQDAIRACKAEVIGYLSASADSAASGIFCSCDSHCVGDFALMLVHSCSLGFMAPIHDFVSYGDIIYKQNKAWLEQTYSGFVSKEEIDDIIVNKRQLLLDADQIRERITNMYEIRDEDIPEEEKRVAINIVEMANNLDNIKKDISELKSLLANNSKQNKEE